MRDRSSSVKFSFRQETAENPRSLFFWGEDPPAEKRLRLAASAFPGLSVFFPADLPRDGFRCDAGDLSAIPASALAAAFSRKDTLTVAYGPREYRALAFFCGCADYLAEPWQPEELLARCDRLRDIYRINLSGSIVRYTPFALLSPHKALPLSLPEFRLLRAFARRLNTPLNRGELFRIMGYTPGRDSPRRVDAHIRRLRKKLDSCCQSENSPWRNPIRQVRGIGYGLWDKV